MSQRIRRLEDDDDARAMDPVQELWTDIGVHSIAQFVFRLMCVWDFVHKEGIVNYIA